MRQFKGVAVTTMALVIALATAGFAQEVKVAVVDLERSVVTSTEGKKGQDKFNTKLEEKRQEIAKLQKDLTDNQNKLQTQQRALSETAAAELNRSIQKQQTDLQRISQDAQTELDSLREQLLQPLMGIARQQLLTLSTEKSYTAVFDVSAQDTNVLWFNPANDLTDELTKRINTATAAAAPATK